MDLRKGSDARELRRSLTWLDVRWVGRFQRACNLLCRVGRRAQARVDRFLPLLGTDRNAFGTDELDIADADEGEDRAQIRFLEVVGLVGRTCSVEATT